MKPVPWPAGLGSHPAWLFALGLIGFTWLQAFGTPIQALLASGSPAGSVPVPEVSLVHALPSAYLFAYLVLTSRRWQAALVVGLLLWLACLGVFSLTFVLGLASMGWLVVPSALGFTSLVILGLHAFQALDRPGGAPRRRDHFCLLLTLVTTPLAAFAMYGAKDGNMGRVAVASLVALAGFAAHAIRCWRTLSRDEPLPVSPRRVAALLLVAWAVPAAALLWRHGLSGLAWPALILFR